MSRLEFQQSTILQATPERALDAFFNPDDLVAWWQVVRSVTVPRPLGTYALDWGSTSYRDSVLGRLGGAFHGIVMEYRPGVEFFVADAYWSPPEGEPIGPMALEVRCAGHLGPLTTKLTVRQSCEDDGPRWRRYFQVVASGWERALSELQLYLESETLRSQRR